MSRDGRHERAVAQSCRFAVEGASIAGFDEAIAWPLAVEMVGGPHSAEWEGKRSSWARQSHDGTPRTGGRFTPPEGAAAGARQNGRP
jgi:hypothetical protein